MDLVDYKASPWVIVTLIFLNQSYSKPLLQSIKAESNDSIAAVRSPHAAPSLCWVVVRSPCVFTQAGTVLPPPDPAPPRHRQISCLHILPPTHTITLHESPEKTYFPCCSLSDKHQSIPVSWISTELDLNQYCLSVYLLLSTCEQHCS